MEIVYEVISKTVNKGDYISVVLQNTNLEIHTDPLKLSLTIKEWETYKIGSKFKLIKVEE